MVIPSISTKLSQSAWNWWKYRHPKSCNYILRTQKVTVNSIWRTVFFAHSVYTHTIKHTWTIASLITSPNYQPAAIPGLFLWCPGRYSENWSSQWSTLMQGLCNKVSDTLKVRQRLACIAEDTIWTFILIFMCNTGNKIVIC